LDPPAPDPGPPAAPPPGALAPLLEPAFALLPDPELANAYPPVASTITATPAAMDVESLCLLKILRLRVILAEAGESGESGEDAGGEGGAAPAPGELAPTDGVDVALVSWGLVGSLSFMMAFLLFRQLRRACRPFL
jgi:hypothetical protein